MSFEWGVILTGYNFQFTWATGKTLLWHRTRWKMMVAQSRVRKMGGKNIDRLSWGYILKMETLDCREKVKNQDQVSLFTTESKCKKSHSRFFPLTNTFKHNGNMNKHVYLPLPFPLHGESKVPEAVIVFYYTVPEKRCIKTYSTKIFL